MRGGLEEKMDKKEIKKILQENDKEIVILISSIDKNIIELIKDLLEYGTPEQIEAIKNMLRNNLNLLKNTV